MSVWVGIQNGACGASAAGFGLRLAYVSTAWTSSWCEEATSNTVSPSAIWLVSCACAQGPEDTTTITLYGAYEEEIHLGKGPVPPRPAYGHSKDGRDDLKQVLLSLGVSSDGLPLRLGVRDGSTSDSTETLRGHRGVYGARTRWGARPCGR